MVSCCAPNCKSRHSKKEPGVTFHNVPKDEKLRDLWIKAARRRGGKWTPSKTSKLCSKHFLEKDFDRTSMCVVRLRENVVPSVFERFAPPLLRKKNKISKKPRAVVKVEKDSPSNIETAENQPDCVQDIGPMTLAKSSIDSDADMDEDRKPIMQSVESAQDIPPIIIQEVHSVVKEPCSNGKLVSHKKGVPINKSKRKSEQSAPDPTARRVMQEKSSIIKPVPLVKIIPRVSNGSPGVAKATKENISIVKPVPLVRIINEDLKSHSPGAAKVMEETSSTVKPVPLVRIIPQVSNEAFKSYSPGVAKATEETSSIVKPVPLIKIIPPVSNEALKSHSPPVAKETVGKSLTKTARGPAGSVMKVNLNCPHCKRACNVCLSIKPLPPPAKLKPLEEQVQHLKQREQSVLKKVKVLNQSVRRLKARNAYLKEVVRYFVKKEKKADLVVIGSINGVLEDECS